MRRQTHFCGIGFLVFLMLFVIMALGHRAIPGQTPNSPCSIKVPQPEPKNLSALARITADQAMASAMAAYPGSRVQRVELENKNGCLVYGVSLSNGLVVKVDAGNGIVVPQEPEDSEDEGKEDSMINKQ